jgi:hypothetical protein
VLTFPPATSVIVGTSIRGTSTGRTVAPPLFETLAALGKQRALTRIAAARQALM